MKKLGRPEKKEIRVENRLVDIQATADEALNTIDEVKAKNGGELSSTGLMLYEKFMQIREAAFLAAGENRGARVL